jgi:hypothetical protein
MIMMRTGSLIAIIVMIILSWGLFPSTSVASETKTQVRIDVISEVYAGDDFIARVSVNGVNDLEAYQIQVSFDENVIQLVGDEGGPTGITKGLFGSTSVDVEIWSYIPHGMPGGNIRILGRVYDDLNVSGSGYLAEIHFKAIGEIGQHSNIFYSETLKFKNGLFNGNGKKIATVTPWSGNTVHLVDYVPLQIVSSVLPVGVTGGIYQAQLTATGGYAPYTWETSDLPPELTLSKSGSISGTTSQTGNHWVNIRVQDDYTPPNVKSKNMVIKTCPLGDANEDGKVTKTDVYKTLRIYLGIDAPTRAADANADGKIDMTDAVQIQRLYNSD